MDVSVQEENVQGNAQVSAQVKKKSKKSTWAQRRVLSIAAISFACSVMIPLACFLSPRTLLSASFPDVANFCQGQNRNAVSKPHYKATLRRFTKPKGEHSLTVFAKLCVHSGVPMIGTKT